MVDIVGIEGGGARRWLKLGGWNFQPSEFAKLTIIIILSSFIDQKWKPEGWNTIDLIKMFLLIFLPAGLVVLQPDLGTAGIIMLIGFFLMVISGMRLKTLFYIFLFFLITLPVMWRFMLDYQKARIVSFLNPYSDPLGKGYHILQSIIAIGSGGIGGKGFGRGTQSVLKFLPSRHTDFAFSVWCEEHGLIGAVFLLGLYAVLIFMLLRISFYAKRRFGSFLVIGIVIMLMVEITINLFMVSGMFPVVGVPLPFFSYGGSSLLVSFMGIGIASSVIWDRITGRFV
jgi:rod shape determining protein RodA